MKQPVAQRGMQLSGPMYLNDEQARPATDWLCVAGPSSLQKSEAVVVYFVLPVTLHASVIWNIVTTLAQHHEPAPNPVLWP